MSLIGMGVVHWKRHDAIEQIEASMLTAVQTVMDEVAPWWIDPDEPQMELTVQIDLVASNDGSCDMDRCEDWHHGDAHLTGLASQTGLFSKKPNHNRDKNDAFVSNNQKSH